MGLLGKIGFAIFLVQIVNNKCCWCAKIPYFIGNTLVFVSPENLVKMQPLFELLKKNAKSGGQSTVEESIKLEKDSPNANPEANLLTRLVPSDITVTKEEKNEKSNTRIRKSTANSPNKDNSKMIDSRLLRNSSEELPIQSLFSSQSSSKDEKPGSSSQPDSADDLKYYFSSGVNRLETIPTCTCGKPERRRVIGGHATDIKKYPWMVQLVQSRNVRAFCGGTIINDLYILTAAHCLTHFDPSDILIRVEHTSTFSPGYFIKVEEIIIHRGYIEWDVEYYDIGLIKLAEPIEFSSKALPICLPPEIVHIRDTPGVIAGWGIYNYDTYETSDVLREAKVFIKDHKQCRNSSEYDDSNLNRLIVCARDDNIDTCQGDSGGPLAYELDNLYVQIGVTSWGIGCAFDTFPGVYTNVHSYYEWIVQHTSDAKWCKSPLWRTASPSKP